MEAKRILITGGPTDEPIDEVMRITNFSTGSFSKAVAREFDERGWKVSLIMNHKVYTDDLRESINIIPIESTEDLINRLLEEKENKYDIVLHASAVGDYKTEFTFLMDDMAEEIFAAMDHIHSAQDIYDILTNPSIDADNSSKISSYHEDLTVKLTLTPKVISMLRENFGNAKLIGCKLLENVSKKELYEVATKLCKKNAMDYIFANDLADLREGKFARHIINQDGFTGRKLDSPSEICDFIEEIL